MKRTLILSFILAASQIANAQSRDMNVPEITVMGHNTSTSPTDYAPTVSELSGARLQRRQSSTLGETLSRETGVSSSQFGPNASRPVIRGLDGERVRILQNGTGVLDASAASQDHAVAIDPLVVDRIEIVRGPAALLYGSSAVGGVVNIVTHRIPELMPNGFEGRADSRYSTNDQGRSGSFALEKGVAQTWAFHADGSLRGADDYHIPGLARTPLERQQPLDPGQSEDDGVVTNSFNRSWNGALGGSYIIPKGFVGASYAQYGSKYGTVAEKGVNIHMKQQRVDLAGGWRNLGWIDSMKLKTSFSSYRHAEIENGVTGTTFKNRGNESRLEIKHRKLGDFDGLFGLQANVFKFEALGDEAFLPPTNNQTFSGFVFEEMTYGMWKPSLGARADFATVQSDDTDKFGASSQSTFNGGSGSLGVIYTMTPAYSLALNASYTERAPNYQELFADGPHVATRQYERGDRGLTKEKSRAVELSLRQKDDNGSMILGAYVQSFDGFIALSPTGATVGTANFREYRYQSVQANLYGAEAEYKRKFAGVVPGGVLEFDFKADFVNSRNEADGRSLPRIPPLRETIDVAYQAEHYRADLEVQRSERQSMTAEFEPETPAYTMLNIGIEAPFEWDNTVINAFARATNLLDAEARNHVSVLKEIAPLPGRNFTVGLQAKF